MRIKIIIFQDNKNNETWIHTDTPANIMCFSKSHEDNEDLMVDLTDNGKWQFNGIIENHAIAAKEFDTVWEEGQAFKDNPERIKKQQKKEWIESEILRAQKTIRQLREKFDNE